MFVFIMMITIIIIIIVVVVVVVQGEVKQVEGEENIEGDKPGFAQRRGH